MTPSPDAPGARTPAGPRTVDTVVVGAGISGLAYAQARGPDAELVVLEAGERAGGCVRTAEMDGCRYECGPEALQDDAPETRSLVAELGLTLVAATEAAARRYVLAEAPPVAPSSRGGMDAVDAAAGAVLPERREVQGRLEALPMGPGAFLRSGLLTAGGKLRALSEPWRRRGTGLDGSVADFIRHRLGRQVLERLVDPFVSGVYAGDPELISARAAFPTLVAMVEEHGSLMKGLKARAKARRAAGEARRGPPSLMTVAGGLGALPEAIASWLGDRLRLGCAARTVARDGEGWRVESADGAWRARQVVVAVPAAAAARLLQDNAVLSQGMGEMVSESVVSVAHLWRRQDVAHPLDGFGYLVPSRLGMRHLGTLFSSSIDPAKAPGDTVLLRTLLGGARHPEHATAGADEVRGIVAEEVGPILGLSAEPLWSTVAVWRAVLPRYDLRHPARQDAIDAELARAPGLAVLGNHRRGISVNALIGTARELARGHR